MGHSREEAELEALQTDVMRFIAILGLCLAAIFSLVHSAALEHAATPSPPIQAKAPPAPDLPSRTEEPPVPTIALKKPAPVAEAEPMPDPEPIPEPPPRTQAVGFTLEFASSAALQTLLQTQQVQLYARRGQQFWLADSRGDFKQAEAPPSYYRMHAETVPPRLQESLPAGDTAGPVTWGVTLPAATVRQIHQLTGSRKGGNLLIGREGGVTLESSQVRGPAG